MENLAQRAKKSLSNYVGDGLELLNFGGSKRQSYTMKIKKAHATESRKIALFPGFSKTKADLAALLGATFDGLITDTIADVTKSGSPKPFASAVEFFKNNPANIVKIAMSVTDALQFENPIEVYEGVNPFGNPATHTISPAEAKDPDQSNDKLVHIEDVNLQWDNQTAVIIEVNPGTTVTITFFIDAVFNTAAALSEAVMQRNAIRTVE